MNRQALWPRFRPVASVSIALRAVAAVVLIFVAVATYHELNESYQTLIANTERQMARLDMVFAEQTGRAMEAVNLLVMGAQETVQARQPALDDVDETLRRRMQGVRQLAAIMVVDQSGQPIASTTRDRAFTPPEAVQALLARFRADPKARLLIGRPFRLADNQWNALLVRPTRAADGTLIGMGIGSVDLTYFEAFYRAVDLSEDGAISLHLRNGAILARFPHIDRVIGLNLGDRPPFTQALAHGLAGTLLMPSPLNGRIRILAIRALKAFPLAVMISVDEGQVLTTWRFKALELIAIALLLGGVMVALLLALSARSRRGEQLLEQTYLAHEMAERRKNRLLQQISERERAEGALRQAQRIEVFGQLTGGVAHDFNNLLTVVLGNVEILQRRLAANGPNEMFSERLGAIRLAAERGATLTSHLLAFARRQPLLPRAIDLNATVRGMRDLLDSALGVQIRVGFKLAGDLWPAMADQNQIELVILNLAINARDAMPNGGLITIETANRRGLGTSEADGPPAGDYVGITVRDTGTGIAPEILDRVFEPFFTTKPPGVGSGLGLSQVFGTARQSGGGVQIETELGRGTAVTVDLPRAIVKPAMRMPPDVRGTRLKGGGARILLVDDDDAVRAVTAAMLRELGYGVHDVNGGAAALDALSHDPGTDVLLTDVVMPEMNGSELAKLAKARSEDLSVVFISGHVDQISDVLDPEDRLIRKPFSASELLQTIEAVVAERPGVLSRA